MAYDIAQIAKELARTALGEGHFGNALRVAKDLPGITDDDRALLDRFATGRNAGTDHVALQDLALRLVAKGAGPEPHGWYWEVVHESTGKVVNDGYSRAPMTSGLTPVRGCVMRVTPLYTNPTNQPKDNT